jgi:hypothetical protein
MKISLLTGLKGLPSELFFAKIILDKCLKIMTADKKSSF